MEMQYILEYIFMNYSYIGTLFITLLEYANFPLPSEIVLPLVGVISSQYNISLINMIIISSIGGITGSLTNYFIGYKYGDSVLNILSNKYSFLEKPINYTKNYVLSNGKKSVFTARMIPLARTAISLVAGAYKMPLLQFICYSLSGIFLWNTILITLGYLFRNNFDLIPIILSRYSLICILIIGIVIFVKLKHKHKQKDKI